MTDHTADPIERCRERGLLPEGFDRIEGAIVEADTFTTRVNAREVLHALATRLLELDDENKRLRGKT
jgi:hypothetical protein